MLLTLVQARALIAERLKPKGKSNRQVRQDIGQKLVRDAKKGCSAFDGGLTREADGRFAASEIAYWAKQRFENEFDDLPISPAPYDMEVMGDIKFGSATEGVELPKTIARCHEVIRLQEEVGDI